MEIGGPARNFERNVSTEERVSLSARDEGERGHPMLRGQSSLFLFMLTVESAFLLPSGHLSP